MLDRSAIEKIEEIAASAQKPVTLEAIRPDKPAAFVVVADGYRIEYPTTIDVPNRIAQRVALHDAKSFIDYLARFATEETAIFFNEAENARMFTAILDYHNAPGDARWCDHAATFAAQTTPEWNTWTSKNRAQFGQVEFATFLEDNLIDVVEPTGAELLEITRTLEAEKDVTYSSGLRLNNGSFRFNFDEQISGSANTKAGHVDIPEQFTLQMQVIRGGSTFQFPARFKYRLKDRALILWYEIVRPHKIIEQALQEAIALIQDQTKITIRRGVPAFSR